MRALHERSAPQRIGVIAASSLVSKTQSGTPRPARSLKKLRLGWRKLLAVERASEMPCTWPGRDRAETLMIHGDCACGAARTAATVRGGHYKNRGDSIRIVSEKYFRAIRSRSTAG